MSLLSLTCSGGPTAKLQVKSLGLGTLTPNYSNADLQIGTTYRMTAIPGPGHRFQTWTVATNWDGNLPKATRTLSFTMRSNLTLTAVFADTNPPAVRVMNLALNQRIVIPISSNAVYTVRGTARDNAGVSNVWYRLDGGPWTQATGTDSWEAPLALSQPVSLFQVYAEDAAGNRSPTCSIRFAYAASDYLTLQTNGLGRISRLFKDNQLVLGQRYTVSAWPDSGQLFSGWSGDITTTANPLSFTMRSNLVLAANFVPNPFPALHGNYNGLFYPADLTGGITWWANATNSGFFSLALTAGGKFTGKIKMEGDNLPFSGTLSLDLQSQVTVPQPGSAPLTINFGLDPEARTISGTVARGAQWTSSLLAPAAATGRSNAFAGTYTLLVQGCFDGGGCFNYAKMPYGDSAACVRVSPSGTIQMVGTLADGSLISQSTTVSANGYWPLYAAPYGGQGILIGWLGFVDYEGISRVVWAKTPSARDSSYYAEGFTSTRLAALIPYTPPPAGQNAVNWTNGMVVLDNSGDVPARMTNQVVIANNQLQTQSGSISNLTLQIAPGSGLFLGSFTHPLTGRRTAFRGAVVQSPWESYFVESGGWFLGPSGASGTIRLQPSEP